MGSVLAGAMLLSASQTGRAAGGPDAAAIRPTYYERLLVEADLAGRSIDDLSLMRNTIYARAGHRFKDPKLRTHFAHQPWYRPGELSKLRPLDLANVRAIAKREQALLSEPLTFPCPEARTDGMLVTRQEESKLVAVGRKFHWDDDYGFPECHRRVQLRCGPDLDGDGQPESIVRIEGHVLINGNSCKQAVVEGNDFFLVAKTFVVSGRSGGWRGVQALGIDIHGDQQSQATTAAFVRRRDGRPAIEWFVSNFDGGNGCDDTYKAIYRMERGTLKVVEQIPDATPCDGQ